MKKLAVLLGCGLIILSFTACSVSEDDVVNSLGEFVSKEYFTSDGFQDYTDYAKYVYDDVDFFHNEYFKQINSAEKEKLIEHIDDFEQWLETIKDGDADNEVVVNYDFDASIISEDDYCYIYDDPQYPEFGNYQVYFFDFETMTLYYFHSKI